MLKSPFDGDYFLLAVICNNKLSRSGAVNHSAKCKYHKYGDIDIVVRRAQPASDQALIYDQSKLLFHWQLYNRNFLLTYHNANSGGEQVKLSERWTANVETIWTEGLFYPLIWILTKTGDITIMDLIPQNVFCGHASSEEYFNILKSVQFIN